MMMVTYGEPSGHKLAGRCLLAGIILFSCFLANCHLAHASCGNEAIRAEQGTTTLPDCRAYELVTPTGNDSDEVKAVIAGLTEPRLSSPEGMYTSVSGNRMAWTSEYVFPGSQAAGLDYLSTRGADGWSTENVIPPQSIQNGTNCPALVAIAAYSSELSRSVLADGYGQVGSFKGESLRCGHDEPLLASGEPLGFQNLFLRDDEHASYQLIDLTPSSAPAPHPGPGNNDQYFPASFLAGSSDLSHVVFEEELPLVEGAGSGDELYDYFDGAVHLVTYLPGGTPSHGVLAGSTPNTSLDEATGEFVPFNLANYRHAMSADGSRVFFEADGNLYARTNPEQQPTSEECASSSNACSVQLDKAQGTAPGPSGGGKFMVASEDGSRVFFTDANPLTSDSNAEPGKPDLYEYDFERPVGSRLIDLTAGSGGPGAVLGVSGAAGSGEDVYFVAEAALTGSQKNTSGAVAQAGDPNLYVANGEAITFIASLDPSADDCDWMSATCLYNGSAFGGLTARTSGNGRFIAFESDLSLTGYHNEGPACVPILNGTAVEGYNPGQCEEIYLYSESENKLECVSCGPSGAPPVGPSIIEYPSAASQDFEMRNSYAQRYVSESGQVFFNSRTPLVPSATNGQVNVYEYENGKPYLISAGTSEANSYFLDASPDGRNVFFATSQALLKDDQNAVYDIYDARTEGGFAETRPVASCEGEECRNSAAGSPTFSTPATVNISEVPAPLPAKKKAVKKTEPKKKKKKRKKRHGPGAKKKKRQRRHGSNAKQRNAPKKTSRGGK